MPGTRIALTRRYLVNDDGVEIYGGPARNGWRFHYTDRDLEFNFEAWSDDYELQDPLPPVCLASIDAGEWFRRLPLIKRQQVRDTIIDFFDHISLHPAMNRQRVEKITFIPSTAKYFAAS
jgi:hypothetical protein